MSNLMIKNGFNGSHGRYNKRVSRETRQKIVCDSKRSLNFPAIIQRDKQTLLRQVKPISPENRRVGISPDSEGVWYDYSYSPSLIRDDSNDCIIFFQDEITELRHLAVTLGIDSRRKSGGVLVRAGDSRWSPVKESNEEQWWKNSKKWIKHMEAEQERQSGHMYETYKPSLRVSRARTEDKHGLGVNNERDKDDVLPEFVKKKIQSVVIPGIGCSYRLPTINKNQKK